MKKQHRKRKENLKMTKEVVESAWDNGNYGRIFLHPYSHQTKKIKNDGKIKENLNKFSLSAI